MPDGAVYVGRPSPWGNPWPVNHDAMPWLAVLFGYYGNAAGCRRAAVDLHRAWITDTLPIESPGAGIATAIASSAANMYLRDFTIPSKPDLTPLRGRDLACWCPLDQPCHADVLLELANAAEQISAGLA